MARGKRVHQPLKKVRITAVRQTVYPDLIAQYENPIEHACTIPEGQEWVSIDAQCPEGLCAAAWASMREFVPLVYEMCVRYGMRDIMELLEVPRIIPDGV